MDEIEDRISETLFILVAKQHNLDLLSLFFNNLKSLEVHIETVPGQSVDATFIKISISMLALEHFSEAYDIGNDHVKGTHRRYETEPIFFFVPFPTPVSVINSKKGGELTNAESIMIIHKILETTKFGHSTGDYGISKLIRKGILMDAYPLHEGPATETEFNDRSLLLRFWSKVALLHKEQPLDLIKRYFGHEVAFYFAWLDYFNMTLIVPSLLGAVVFLISLMKITFYKTEEIHKICNEKERFVCPACEHSTHCKFIPFASSCSMIQWTFVFDNYFTIGFAVYMSFVATMFLTLWRRKEHMLKLRWSAESAVDSSEVAIRPIYWELVKRKRRNKLTGKIEPYTPLPEVIFRYSISIMVCGVMVIIMLLFLLLNISSMIQFRDLVDQYGNDYLKNNLIIFSIIIGSLIQLFYIKFMSLFFGPITVTLTNFENPRTKSDYYNSVLYKRYVLAFINNLMPLFYLAFVKGKLYTRPHENDFYLKQDICQPLSCVVPLCIQLTFLLTLRSFAGNLGNFVYPHIKALYKKIFNITEAMCQLPQWEEEYFLEPSGKYFLTSEYADMMVKFAMVTFFVGAFPLAPMCALINNLTELRSDAYKLVKTHRRPVPVKKGSIGVWNAILKMMTSMSAATNAFVIAFTSDFIPNQMYYLQPADRKRGFFNFTFSKYATKDYPLYQVLENKVEFCFYRGQYNPPDTPEAYEPNKLFWKTLTARFLGVTAFENIIMLLNYTLSYLFPPVPYSVMQKLYLDKKVGEKKEIINAIDTSSTTDKKSVTELLKVDMNYIT